MNCASCDASLAHDQRYCVECGERRGPLPEHAAGRIAGIVERGDQAPTSRGPAAPEGSTFIPDSLPLPSWLRTPRAAAAAVLAMLGFGVVVGSTVGPGLASVVRRAVVVVLSGGSAPATQIANAGAGSGGGGGGGSSTTTATTPASNTAGSTTTSTTPTLAYTGVGFPPIKHVFLVVLGDQGYAETFSSRNTYFSKTLLKQGELIPNYYGVTGGDLANEIALVSGQGPTPQTAAACTQYAKFTSTGTGKFGQVLGSGCVYPAKTETLAGQLSGHKEGGWKAYIEGMNDAPGQTCSHPAIGAADSAHLSAKDQYATWRNPFVYFDSVTGSHDCKKDDVGLTHLAKDLKSTSTTPELSYIAPSPCDDGSDQPCRPGAAAGLAPAQKFLEKVLPEIEHSPAYKADGLILVTFAQAPQTGLHADPGSCTACDPQTYPNVGATVAPAIAASVGTTTTTTVVTPPAFDSTSTTTTPTTTTTTTTTSPPPPPTSSSTTTSTNPGATTTTTTTTTTTPPGGPSPGGGQVGLLLISHWVKANFVDTLDYFNHFSLLGSLELILKLKQLGYAHDIALPKFTSSVFTPG